MKKMLALYIALLVYSCAFAQSFEGKLTYLTQHLKGSDTIRVFIRGDSIRIDLSPKLNASTYLYFVEKKLRFYYSKRDKAYFSHPLLESASPKEVLTYELGNSPDSITLHYKEKQLNLSLNIETITEAALKLHPQLSAPFLKGIHVEHLVLNGSGYIARETNIALQFISTMGIEKRISTRKLIHIDYTKPDVALFKTK